MKIGKNIRDNYKPYNFSSTKCHVIEVIVSETGVTKIEARLPEYLKKVKGIYITSQFTGEHRLVGYISLSFNEGSLKSFQMPVINSKAIKHNSQPIALNEEIKSGSSIQGFFLDINNYAFSYTLKIYLHYL